MSNHVANELLSGETLPELVPLDEHWRLAREGMDQRRQEAWERAQAQWFKPLYNTPEPEPEPAGLSVRAMFAWVGGALVFFTVLAVVILMIYRG